MILRFDPAATTPQREAVAEALRRRGVEFTATPGALVLEGAPSAEDALAVAALPGVAEIVPLPEGETVREALLTWAGGATVVLGLLFIAAANMQATLGAPADPLRTPPAPRPSWPLFAWYAAVDMAPSWAPVPLFFVLAALVLFFWPNLARRFADKSPVLHASLGVAALIGAAALAAQELWR